LIQAEKEMDLMAQNNVQLKQENNKLAAKVALLSSK
jgi:hypothetical protein